MGEAIKESLAVQIDALQAEIDRRLYAAEAARRQDLEQAAVVSSNAERALDKFEQSVATRFYTVNEFRGALSDLSKEMATRREIENLSNATNKSIEINAEAIANLRSRIDSGPAELRQLQNDAFEYHGRQRAGEKLTATVGVWIGGAAIVLSLLVEIILHFI